MTKLDLFTERRLLKFIADHRARHGQLPTARDLEDGGFDRALIDRAIKSGAIESFYVTLTNGQIVKGFKPKG